MKYFSWNPAKNEWLKAVRKVSFEQTAFQIARNDVFDIVEHPNKQRYKHQRIFVVRINDYVYLVPFVETDEEVFLKTIIPSRKATKRYLKGEKDNEPIE